MNIEGNLTDGFKQLFGPSIEGAAMGEKVSWDIIPMMIDKKGYALTIVVMVSGIVVNTIIQGAAMIGEIPNITQEACDALARQMMDQLLDQRSKSAQSILSPSAGSPSPGSLELPSQNGSRA